MGPQSNPVSWVLFERIQSELLDSREESLDWLIYTKITKPRAFVAGDCDSRVDCGQRYTHVRDSHSP